MGRAQSFDAANNPLVYKDVAITFTVGSGTGSASSFSSS
jgi:hypothetical protein